jgi:hypothetical protein
MPNCRSAKTPDSNYCKVLQTKEFLNCIHEDSRCLISVFGGFDQGFPVKFFVRLPLFVTSSRASGAARAAVDTGGLLEKPSLARETGDRSGTPAVRVASALPF